MTMIDEQTPHPHAGKPCVNCGWSLADHGPFCKVEHREAFEKAKLAQMMLNAQTQRAESALLVVEELAHSLKATVHQLRPEQMTDWTTRMAEVLGDRMKELEQALLQLMTDEQKENV